MQEVAGKTKQNKKSINSIWLYLELTEKKKKEKKMFVSTCTQAVQSVNGSTNVGIVRHPKKTLILDKNVFLTGKKKKKKVSEILPSGFFQTVVSFFNFFIFVFCFIELFFFHCTKKL